MHVAVRRAGEFRSVRFPAWAPIQNEAYPPNVFMVLVVPISMGTAGRQIRAGPARWLRGPGRTALTTPDGLHGPPRAEIVQEAQIFAVTETTAHAVIAGTFRDRFPLPPSCFSPVPHHPPPILPRPPSSLFPFSVPRLPPQPPHPWLHCLPPPPAPLHPHSPLPPPPRFPSFPSSSFPPFGPTSSCPTPRPCLPPLLDPRMQ